MISLGGVIGAGLFVGSGAAILSAGPAVIFSYAIAGLVALLIMRMLGEMAVADPGRGSFVEYIRLALGPGAGFVSGWLYWYFWVVVVAVETIAATQIIRELIPVPVWLIHLVLVGAMTATNLLSVKTYGEFEFWFASIKVAAIVAFGLLCISFIAGVGGSSIAAFDNLTAFGGFMPHGAAAVLAAVPVVLFAVTGAEVAAVAAAESDDPAHNVARAARSMVLRILALYVSSVFLIVCVLPWNTLIAGESPFVAVMNAMRIPAAAPMMAFIVLTAVLSCLNSGLYVGSRVLFELAGHGDAPRWLAHLGARNVPSRAILAGALIGFLLATVPAISPGRVFTFLINASGTLVLFIYVAIAASQIVLRWKAETQPQRTLTFKMWLFPYLSYLTISAIGLIIAAMAFMADQRYQLVASAGSLVFVVTVYLVRRAQLRSSIICEEN